MTSPKTKHPGLPVERVPYDPDAVVISNPALTGWAMREQQIAELRTSINRTIAGWEARVAEIGVGK